MGAVRVIEAEGWGCKAEARRVESEAEGGGEGGKGGEWRSEAKGGGE